MALLGTSRWSAKEIRVTVAITRIVSKPRLLLAKEGKSEQYIHFRDYPDLDLTFLLLRLRVFVGGVYTATQRKTKVSKHGV